MDAEELLIKIGLQDKEAKIYLALLDIGSEKVQAIAKQADIKRPTAYVILEQLYAKNYVTKTYHGKTVFYTAENPDILLRHIKQQQELLKESLPLLIARMTTSKVRPRVLLYEGKNGVEQVYDEIYQSKSVWLITSIKNLSEELSGRIEILKKILKSRNIKVRDLMTEDPKDIDFGIASAGKNYEARVVAPEFDFFADAIIYGDRVAILSVKKDFFAVIIDSKEVADTFRSLFEIAWKFSTPLKDFQMKLK